MVKRTGAGIEGVGGTGEQGGDGAVARRVRQLSNVERAAILQAFLAFCDENGDFQLEFG